MHSSQATKERMDNYISIPEAHALDSALTDCAYIEKAIQDFNDDVITRQQFKSKFKVALKSLTTIYNDLEQQPHFYTTHEE